MQEKSSKEATGIIGTTARGMILRERGAAFHYSPKKRGGRRLLTAGGGRGRASSASSAEKRSLHKRRKGEKCSVKRGSNYLGGGECQDGEKGSTRVLKKGEGPRGRNSTSYQKIFTGTSDLAGAMGEIIRREFSASFYRKTILGRQVERRSPSRPKGNHRFSLFKGGPKPKKKEGRTPPRHAIGEKRNPR